MAYTVSNGFTSDAPLVSGANPIVGVSAFGQNTGINGNRMQPDAYYSNMFLERKRFKQDELVFAQFAEQREITKGLDTINLRQYQPLKAHIVPLVEGLAPAADRAHGKAIVAKTRQYGRFMEFTDQFEFKVADPVIEEYTMELADLANETIDMLAQAALLAEAQVFFPIASAKANKADLATLAGTDRVKVKPTWEDLRVIKLTMEAAKVKSIGGAYIVLASPAVFFDLQTDETVKNFMLWGQTNQPMSADSLPTMYGLTVKKAPTAHTELVGSATVHHTIVLGAKAFTKVAISGSGSVQFFRKELGSAGTLDPLNQRQTIGWKLSNIGFKVTDTDAVVDYMSVPSHAEVITGNFDYVAKDADHIGITEDMITELKKLEAAVADGTKIDLTTGIDDKLAKQFADIESPKTAAKNLAADKIAVIAEV